MSKVSYRVGQFWNALTAVPEQPALTEISGILSPQLMALFTQMQPAEQAHSLSVYCKIRSAGLENKDLWVAALLHDVGKVKFPLNLWERVEIVLFNKIAPEKAHNWGLAQPAGWRKPFVVAVQHPDWGADLAKQAGASPLTVSLIRRHQEHAVEIGDNSDRLENQLLKQLQIYDNES